MDIRLGILNPEPGDVVLAYLPQGIAMNEVEAVARTAQTVFPNNHVMLLPPGMDLATADEAVMAEAGWVPIA